LADGELSPSLRRPVQAHLRECWECSENIEVLRMVKASLRRQSARLAPMETARLRRVAARVAGTGPSVG
jgi:anti-sigma factor RsiW